MGVRNSVLTAEPLIVSGEAATRMGRRTLKAAPSSKFYSARLQYHQLCRLHIYGQDIFVSPLLPL